MNFEEMAESDTNNMQVAYDRATEQMQEHLKGDVSAPALYALIATLVDKVYEASPGTMVLGSVDPSIQNALVVATTQAFFTGLEWGKAGRELFTAPATTFCKDPSHDHHASRLN